MAGTFVDWNGNPYKLEPHEFSRIFNPAYGTDLQHLRDSLKREKKLRFPIIIYENKRLDGNQRIRVCQELRLDPRCKEFKGTREEALNLVFDLNFARRNMTAPERATAVAKATFP